MYMSHSQIHDNGNSTSATELVHKRAEMVKILQFCPEAA